MPTKSNHQEKIEALAKKIQEGFQKIEKHISLEILCEALKNKRMILSKEGKANEYIFPVIEKEKYFIKFSKNFLVPYNRENERKSLEALQMQDIATNVLLNEATFQICRLPAKETPLSYTLEHGEAGIIEKSTKQTARKIAKFHQSDRKSQVAYSRKDMLDKKKYKAKHLDGEWSEKLVTLVKAYSKIVDFLNISQPKSTHSQWSLCGIAMVTALEGVHHVCHCATDTKIIPKKTTGVLPIKGVELSKTRDSELRVGKTEAMNTGGAELKQSEDQIKHTSPKNSFKFFKVKNIDLNKNDEDHKIDLHTSNTKTNNISDRKQTKFDQKSGQVKGIHKLSSHVQKNRCKNEKNTTSWWGFYDTIKSFKMTKVSEISKLFSFSKPRDMEKSQERWYALEKHRDASGKHYEFLKDASEQIIQLNEEKRVELRRLKNKNTNHSKIKARPIDNSVLLYEQEMAILGALETQHTSETLTKKSAREIEDNTSCLSKETDAIETALTTWLSDSRVELKANRIQETESIQHFASFKH